jgi:hypothetical protein
VRNGNITTRRKLSPKGNPCWSNMAEDDTLLEPLPDVVMDSLRNNIHNNTSTKRPLITVQDEWEKSTKSTDDYNKRAQNASPVKRNLINNMMIEPTAKLAEQMEKSKPKQ